MTDHFASVANAKNNLRLHFLLKSNSIMERPVYSLKQPNDTPTSANAFKSCFFIQHKWHVVGKPTQKKETSFSETSSKLIFLGNLKCKPKIFIF